MPSKDTIDRESLLWFRCPAEGWECSLSELMTANEDGLTQDEVSALYAANVGESVNLGGGAAGITTVERIA